MQFTKESQLVQDFVLLIQNGIKKIDEIPNLYNLREVVESVVNN